MKYQNNFLFLSGTDRESILNVCLFIEIFQPIHVVGLLINLFNQHSLVQDKASKANQSHLTL